MSDVKVALLETNSHRQGTTLRHNRPLDEGGRLDLTLLVKDMASRGCHGRPEEGCHKGEALDVHNECVENERRLHTRHKATKASSQAL